MKHFRVYLIALFCLWPTQGFAQSQQAQQACHDVNPAGAWRECIQQYDQKLWQLQQDPRWQAYQRQLAIQQEQQRQQAEFQRRQLEQQRQQAAEQQRQMQELIRQQQLQQPRVIAPERSFWCSRNGSFIFCN